MNIKKIRKALAETVFGQPKIYDEILFRLEIAEAGLQGDGDTPLGAFFLLGPTGTGKSHSVKALAKAVHGNADCLIHIDANEFQMEHEVAKLIGAPPGYLGHRETQPRLTNSKLGLKTSNNCLYTIILIDEIEKASPAFFRLFLGILDHGKLTLGDSSTVNFRKTIIFFTSNLGVADIKKLERNNYAFETTTGASREAREAVYQKSLEKQYSPEFLARISAFITFAPLTREAAQKIVEAEVEAIRSLVMRSGRYLEVSAETITYLLEKSVTAEYGAREVRRVCERELKVKLAPLMFDKKTAGMTLAVTMEDGVLVVEAHEPAVLTA